MKAELIKAVRIRRERLGWTQAELARCLGSSPSRVCKLEVGDRSVSLDLVARALAVMGVSIVPSVDREQDPLDCPGLTEAQRTSLARRWYLQKWAERIADRHGVDSSDVLHVLQNLEQPALERLRSAFRRARLRRRS